MNKIVFSAIFMISQLLIGPDQPLFAQDKNDAVADSAFVSWAKAHALPVNASHLDPINTVIGRASVVALGEPAHGFHGSLEFRNAMFRYMVENSGFTTIVLETNLAKTKLAEDYVAGGAGTAQQAAKALTIADPTTEDIELLTWMRKYNQQPDHQRKVKLYGMDIEMVGLPQDTVPSHPAIDEALSYLRRTDAPAAARFTKVLGPFLSLISVANYGKLSKTQHEELSGILDALVAVFQKNRSRYISLSSATAYDWAYQNAIAARQTDRVVRLQPAEASGKIAPEAWKAMSARDSAMADNVLWMLKKEGKLFVYAHNAHVKNAPTTGGVWNAFQQPPNSTGQYLRKALGPKLVIFGISFSTGFNIKQPGSLESALEKTGRSDLLLDLKTANTDQAAAKWLATPHAMQANMVSYFKLRLDTAFNAIVFLGQVTPAIRVK